VSGLVENSRTWAIIVALWGIVGGGGQIAYTIAKGHIFNPWSREEFDKNSCLFWLAIIGSVGGILVGVVLLLLA
jgi:hypothetical protein